MPFSALRNSIPRKTNKERAQPSHRKRLGLLEKHKDYVQRAQDFHKKKDAITTLRRKASFRNPDEFYMAMNKAKTKEGVHQVDHGIEHLPHGYIQLLKTQDQAYVHMKRAQDTKKVERLKGELHFLVDQPRNSHTVFVDDEAEAEAFDPAEHFDTAPELAGRAYNRPRKEALDTQEMVGAASRKELRKLRKKRELSYRELSERMERSGKMKNVLDRMKVERDVMGKGRKRKVKDAEDGKPPVYKWKRERLR